MAIGIEDSRSVQRMNITTIMKSLQWSAAHPLIWLAKTASKSGLGNFGLWLLSVNGQFGNLDAKFRVGCELETGQNFPVNPKVARKWFKKAADKGHVNAMLHLSRLCLLQHPSFGMKDGIAKAEHFDAPPFEAEPQIARHYAILAADTGNVEGLNLAGYLLSTGQGGPVDIPTALQLYSGAMAAGHPDACIGLGTLFMTGKTGKVDYPSARGCFRIAASSGNSFARYSLAMMLLNGLGGPVDEEEAIGLFAAAARKGHVPSMKQLAKWHLEEGRSANQRRAGIAWLRKLANLDELSSVLDLLNRYRKGIDVVQSVEESRKWLQRAAELGDAQSQFELAKSHIDGDFEGADVSIAIQLLRAAARSGHPGAQVYLDRLLPPPAAPAPVPQAPVETGFDFGFGRKVANGTYAAE